MIRIHIVRPHYRLNRLFWLERLFEDLATLLLRSKSLAASNLLNITDIPLEYAPPRGPAVGFQVTYNLNYAQNCPDNGWGDQIAAPFTARES